MMMDFEDCLPRGGSSDLVSALLSEGLSSATLTQLNHLVIKDLSVSSFSRVVLVFKSLETLSENKDHLQTLIDLGLTHTVLLWFEAIHDLLTSDLQKNYAPLQSLTEQFYDYFLLLGQASLPVSQLSAVLLQLVQFALETKIHIPLRLEAIRTFNSILESLSREERRMIKNDPQQIKTQCQVASEVLTAGDYELQVSLSEALCRLTRRAERQQRAFQWFSRRDISSAFCDIRDGDFEVDCRRFLNFVNRSHGDQRRVFTFPCQRAFLDSTELFRPKDEQLEEFWIDFNLGSGCVSFFIDDPQDLLWGSVHLMKDDVDHYGFELKHDVCAGPETVLSIWLNNPIMHNNIQGQTVELKFSCEHHRDLEEAARRILKRETTPRCKMDTGGTVQALPPDGRLRGSSYSRKKSQSKSQLKILPLSSASSEEDSGLTMTVGSSTAELLFDQIRHSTPSFRSGVPVVEEQQLSPQQTWGWSISPIKKEVLSLDRKRGAPDSGYLTDQDEGQSPNKKRVEPCVDREVLQTEQMEKAEPHTVLEESSPEGEGLQHDEAELLIEDSGPNKERVGPVKESGVEPKSDLTSSITAAFNNFRTQLEQHFTGCWQDMDAQVLQSLKEYQQHVSSLVTAVHQHRLLLLQAFDNSVSDQLKRLQESSESLNTVNTQILNFLRSEMQRLGSFCDEHLHRLKSFERDGSSEPPSL